MCISGKWNFTDMSSISTLMLHALGLLLLTVVHCVYFQVQHLISCKCIAYFQVQHVSTSKCSLLYQGLCTSMCRAHILPSTCILFLALKKIIAKLSWDFTLKISVRVTERWEPLVTWKLDLKDILFQISLLKTNANYSLTSLHARLSRPLHLFSSCN
jgi:hypothetical protein